MPEEHIAQLGMRAEDKISGIAGVITAISFDLYGCVQACLSPGVVKQDGKLPESYWYDIKRLRITSRRRAMQMPDFSRGYVAEGKKGAAPKPPLH